MRWQRFLAVLCFAALSLFTVQRAQVDAQESKPAAKAQAPKFVGTDACKACHKPIYDVWLETQHAKSFSVLPAEGQTNPTCLGCHVTGFKQAGGFDPAAQKPGLAAIGCEACHGAASEYRMIHSKDKEKAVTLGLVRDPNEARCKDCHAGKVPEGHPPIQPFDFAKMYLKIEHHLPSKK